jgi:hypothetical protein
MKLAVLFFGLSKCHYHHYTNKVHFIDYHKSYENYKEFIFNFFKSKGYDIDVYFTTNILDDEDKNEICKLFNPVKYHFMQNDVNHLLSRNKKLINVVNLCLESENTYDLILITRFDLLFQKNFLESNIELDKFNLVSMLEKKNFICDNFYLFPNQYLKIFLTISNNNINKRFHEIKKDLYEKIPSNEFNYILNENCYVHQLSFYNIVRTIVLPKKEEWIIPKKSDTKFGFIDSINNTPYKIKSVFHKPERL